MRRDDGNRGQGPGLGLPGGQCAVILALTIVLITIAATAIGFLAGRKTAPKDTVLCCTCSACATIVTMAHFTCIHCGYAPGGAAYQCSSSQTADTENHSEPERTATVTTASQTTIGRVNMEAYVEMARCRPPPPPPQSTRPPPPARHYVFPDTIYVSQGGNRFHTVRNCALVSPHTHQKAYTPCLACTDRERRHRDAHTQATSTA